MISRSGKLFSMSVVLSSLCFVSAGSVQAGMGDAPKRKAGLWQISTVNSAAPGHPTRMQQCIDESTDNIMQQQGQKMSQDRCSKNEVRREGNRYVVESVCKFGGTTSVTKGVYSGDFSSHYKGEMHTTYDPPMMGMQEADMQIEAQWLGACKPGQKPGDVVVEGMPAGMPKFNLQDMMKPR